WSRKNSFNLVQLALIIIGALVIALTVARFAGYLPWRSVADTAAKPQPTGSVSQSQILLGGFAQKLYYFEPGTRAIYEHTPADNRTLKLIDSSLSIAGVFTSHDQQKLALLSTGDAVNNGVYVLDMSVADKKLQAVVRPDLLPSGYTLQPNSVIIWSPQSAQIAFVAYKETRPDLFVAPVSAQGRVQHLRNPGSQIGMVVWLDEQTIAFVTHQDGKDVMYKVNNNGGDLLLIH